MPAILSIQSMFILSLLPKRHTLHSASQEPFRQAGSPANAAFPSRNLDFIALTATESHSPSTGHPHAVSAAHATSQRAAGDAAESRTLLHTKALPSLELTFQPQRLLLLFSQLPLRASGKQLVRALGCLEFVNRLEELVELVPHPANVFLELVILLLFPVNLCLQVFDGAIHIANRAL